MHASTKKELQCSCVCSRQMLEYICKVLVPNYVNAQSIFPCNSLTARLIQIMIIIIMYCVSALFLLYNIANQEC